jgi:hypothetical protein
MDVSECGHHMIRSEYGPFEYDLWSCYQTLELYQLFFRQRSIRWCFFEVHPDFDPNIPLLHEFEDPGWLCPLPSVAYYRPQVNNSSNLVKDSVLGGENQ